MAEGSSVDSSAIDENEKKLDGLNLTSQILKEDEAYDRSWDSFLEDSIDRRAAKALHLNSVKELLAEEHSADQDRAAQDLLKFRTESLVNVIMSSMATDMRRAVCSVSPSPKRLSRKTSQGSNSVASTTGSSATPLSHLHAKSAKLQLTTESCIGYTDHLSDEMQQLCDLQLASDDSFLSEPELDLAFNRPHQTIDILSAAGNLQERSGVHGGYGTPSSYASEQEMKLYFDSTPLPDVELESFSGDNFDEMPSDRVEAELHTITALNEKMKNEIVAVEAQDLNHQKSTATPNEKNESKNNKTLLSSAVFQCTKAVEKLEDFVLAAKIHSLPPDIYPNQNPSHRITGEAHKISQKSAVPLRRNSDGTIDTRILERNINSMPKVNAETRLSKMLKRASETYIDDDISKAVVLNLTTPDFSQVQFSSDELAPFESFQENLRKLKALDKDSKTNQSSDADYISEDYSPRSDNSSKQTDDDQSAIRNEDLEPASLEPYRAAVKDKSFINESIARVYNSPLLPDFEITLQSQPSEVLFANAKAISTSAHDPDELTTTNSDESFTSSPEEEEEEEKEEEEEDLSLDLSGLDESESSDEEELTPLLLQECEGIITTTIQSESPIYFERDNDRIEGVYTARQQLDVVTSSEESKCNKENISEHLEVRDDTTSDVPNMNTTSFPPKPAIDESNIEEQSVDYYHTAGEVKEHPEKDTQHEDNFPAFQDNKFLMSEEDWFSTKCNADQETVSQFADSLTEDIFDFSEPSKKKTVHSESAISTSKCELINTFADALANEMMHNMHLSRKNIDSVSCCDRGTESGYCTTTESRSRKTADDEDSSEKTQHQQEKQSEPVILEFCLNSKENHAEPDVPVDDLSFQSEAKDISKSKNNGQCKNVEQKQESESTVFEAKVSAFAACIKSYEQYEPQANRLTELKLTNEFEQTHLLEVAKNEVDKIINECLSSLQNETTKTNKESSIPNPKIVESASDNLSTAKEITSKHDNASAESSCLSVGSGPSKETDKINPPKTLSSDNNAYHQSCYEPTTKKLQLESASKNKSAIPKVLITHPSIDFTVDEDDFDESSKTTLQSIKPQLSLFATENISEIQKYPKVLQLRHQLECGKEQNAFAGSKSVNSNDPLEFDEEIPQECATYEMNKKEVKNLFENLEVVENHDNVSFSETSLRKIPNDYTQNPDDSAALSIPTPEEFALNLKCKYKDLDKQISRVLNPTPSPPPQFSSDVHYCESANLWSADEAATLGSSSKRVRFHNANQKNAVSRNTCDYFQEQSLSQKIIDSEGSNPSTTVGSSKYSDTSSPAKNFASSHNHSKVHKPMSEDFQSISHTLQFIKENLNRNDASVRRLEDSIRESWIRMLALDERGELERARINEVCLHKMSPTKGNEEGPTKVRALEEVVGLLKKHIQQREAEISGLGSRLRQSNEKIKELEQKLKDKNLGIREDRNMLNKELKIFQKERDILQKRINERLVEKEDAKVATRKARRDLDLEKEKQKIICSKKSYQTPESHRSRNKELRERVDDLEFLNKPSEFEKPELDFDSVQRENRSLRAQNDQTLLDLKTDNLIMKEKLDRMNEISTENLILQSDAADFQAELADLRSEAKHLRSKCYELTEDNRQCKAEIRDLRRYIELLKANKTGDSRQDLLNKIEYYQMEHDRLIDEIRRLKQRLGEVSPRSPRQRSPSPPVNGYASYPGPSSTSRSSPHSQHTVTFSKSLERGRSPVSDAMAASTASSLAAARLVKGRSISPSAALNIRDLTMERYNQHMDGRGSPHSIDSDSTEFLLKPQSTNHHSTTSGMPSSLAPPAGPSDDDDVEYGEHRNGPKLSDSFGSNHEGFRSSSRDNVGCSPCKRSCSPTSTGGFRSISPRMTSTQNQIPDTARDRYPTKIKKSLPRRAFAPRSPADLKLGYCIKFTRPGGRLSRGTVKYIGHLPTRNEIFIGVELDGHDGKHSGTFQGTKYFTCPSNKGIFTPFSKIIMAWE